MSTREELLLRFRETIRVAPDAYTVDETAAMLGKSERTIRRWIEKGEIHVHHDGYWTWIPIEEVVRLLRRA